jgi:hypothetical protein
VRPRARPAWIDGLATAAWLVLLAVMPWWLGLPWLLSLAAAGLLLQHRLAARHAALVRHALRWGLPGVLLALQRSLGGALGVALALLGALAGYTLLVGMEAWLDRKHAHPPVETRSAEWPELSRRSMGPPAKIIELQPPQWCSAAVGLDDPVRGHGRWQQGSYTIDDGRAVEAVADAFAFSASARWLAARLPGQQGIVLWDRQHDRRHRLRGWQLCGWHEDEVWLCRRDDEMPLPLAVVLEDAESL